MENQGADELRGDWVIGATVMSTEGEEIGAIDDVILDAEEGNVTAAVLSVGGFLGLGAKSIAVDWSELQIDWGRQRNHPGPDPRAGGRCSGICVQGP